MDCIPAALVTSTLSSLSKHRMWFLFCLMVAEAWKNRELVSPSWSQNFLARCCQNMSSWISDWQNLALRLSISLYASIVAISRSSCSLLLQRSISSLNRYLRLLLHEMSASVHPFSFSVSWPWLMRVQPATTTSSMSGSYNHTFSNLNLRALLRKNLSSESNRIGE